MKITTREAILAARALNALVKVALGGKKFELANQAGQLARQLGMVAELSNGQQNILVSIHGKKEGQGHAIKTMKALEDFQADLQDLWTQPVEIEPLEVPKAMLVSLPPGDYVNMAPVLKVI